MTPRQKADRAKQIVEDPVFQGMLADIRESIVAKLEQVGDLEVQHDLALSLQVLKRMKLQLMKYSDEIVLDNAIERERSWVKRAKSLMP